MVSVSQTFASGNWVVTSGREDEFISRWTEFLQWTKVSAPGFIRATLIRHTGDDPRHFVSFAEWDNVESRGKWRSIPGYADRFSACKALTDEFHGGDYTVAVSITR